MVLSNPEHITSRNAHISPHEATNPGNPKGNRFSPEQLKVLEAHFKIEQRPSPDTMKLVAEKIGAGKKRVQIWFQNRRAKDRTDNRRKGLPEPPKNVYVDQFLPPMTIQNPVLWELRRPFVLQQQYNIPPPPTLPEPKVVCDPVDAMMLRGLNDYLESPAVIAESTLDISPIPGSGTPSSTVEPMVCIEEMDKLSQAEQNPYFLPDWTSLEVSRTICPPLGSTDIRSPFLSFTHQMIDNSAFDMPGNGPTELLEDETPRNNRDQTLEYGTPDDSCWPSADEFSHSMEPMVFFQTAAQNDDDETVYDSTPLHESIQHSVAKGFTEHRELDSHKLAYSVDLDQPKETAVLQVPDHGVFKKPTVSIGSLASRRSRDPRTLGSITGQPNNKAYKPSPLSNSSSIVSGRIQKSTRPAARRTPGSKLTFKEAGDMDHFIPYANPSPLSMSMLLSTLPTGQVLTFPLTPSDNGEQPLTKWSSVPSTPLALGESILPPISAPPHLINFSHFHLTNQMLSENDRSVVHNLLPQSANSSPAVIQMPTAFYKWENCGPKDFMKKFR